MFTTRSLLLLSLVAPPATASAQVLTQPLPRVGHQSSFQVSNATSSLPFARLNEEKSRTSGLEALLIGAAVGAALGLIASPLVVCTYSTDRSCTAKTMGISALAIGLIALSASF